MSDELDPTGGWDLIQKHLDSLRGRLELLHEADELQVLAGKRGSRRWLPDRREEQP